MIRTAVLSAMVAAGLWAQSGGPSQGTAEEVEVVREINNIRRFPKEYAKYIRTLGTRFEGNLWRLPGRVPIRTNEGRAAVDEAVGFLERVAPIQAPVTFSQGLHRSARDHVRSQGPGGKTGHVGLDGSSTRERIARFGIPGSLTGEIINYGKETPRMTVIQLVIDDGVANRGHRTNIFNPDFKVAGAAIGPHRDYGTMTVVDLADALTEGP